MEKSVREAVRKKLQEPLRFALVGGAATAVHYGIYLLLNTFLPTWLAYSAGYAISFVMNFFLSSVYTFRTKPTWGKGVGFGLSHLINYFLHMFFLEMLLWAGVPEQWVPLPVFALVVPINFFLVRFALKHEHPTTHMKSKLFPLLVLTLTFAFVVSISYLAIWLGDDSHYQFSFATHERIRSLADIVTSQHVHYMKVNGRYLAHFLCQLYLALVGRVGFALSNGCVTLLFILLLYRHALPQTRNALLLAIAALAALVGFPTKFVPTCQIGYVWMFTLTLATLCVFFHATKREHRWLPWVALPLAFMAGSGQEALSLGVAGAFVLHAALHARRLTRLQWCIVGGYGLGALALVVSPGSRGRLSEAEQTPFVQAAVLSIYSFFTELRVSYAFVALLLAALWKKKLTLKMFYQANAFELHTMALCVAFNFFVHIYCNRQLFGIELMALVLSLRLLHTLGSERLQQGVFLVVLVLTLAFCKMNYTKGLRRAADLEAVLRKYAESPDGVVYHDVAEDDMFYDDGPCDPVRQAVSLNWLNAELREYPQNEGKELRILPTLVKQLPEDNFASISPYGNVLVVCHKGRYRSVTVKRSLAWLGIRIPHRDYVLDSEAAIYEDSCTVVFFAAKNPLIQNEEVIIE